MALSRIMIGLKFSPTLMLQAQFKLARVTPYAVKSDLNGDSILTILNSVIRVRRLANWVGCKG